ncbi:MAG TPA: hypothetical protein VHN19_08735 [Burkholderiales bacterium]|jgi:hypothetical protein|nr:hypothetical protein [Burkholderiales bacterium]
MTLDALKGHPLKAAAEEFALADQAYRRMVNISVGNFAEYEKAWRDFLHRIERVWVKTQAAVHHLPKWQRVESEIGLLRRKDPLLSYLQQARNVDEHTISDLAQDWDPKLKVVQKGNKVHVTWQPWDRPLLPVKNRGVTFAPPKVHLGKNIEHLKGKGKGEPRVIAELALRFYCDFLNRVSADVLGPIQDDNSKK